MITTEDLVRDYGSVITGGDSQEMLAKCLAMADAWIKGRLSTNVEKQPYGPLRLSGAGENGLILPHWPLVSVESLTVNGQTWRVIDDTDDEAGQECAMNKRLGLILARFGVFPEGVANVQVSFTAGVDPVPMDLQVACAIIARLYFIETKRLGEGARTLGPENITVMLRNVKDYDTLVEQPIRNFRRLV